ncbi:hypothetical protein [Natrialba asiatica]|uniref:hypothetical protein n=1 Tax=Natrialba asiatica TaxID=64602 RepID=UPI000677C1B7|nr:hypothetical protein [Natrialba asiatica]
MKYITFVVPPVEYESEDETDSPNELTREAEVTYNLNLSDDGATIEHTYLHGDQHVFGLF